MNVLNKKIEINTRNFLLGLILFLGILPAIELSVFTIPMQYLMTPVFALIIFLLFLGKFKIPHASKLFVFLWILIILGVLFSSVFSPMLKAGKFNLPTESIQYIVRFLFFTVFIVFFYNIKINTEKFMKWFLIILSLGMMVAVFQYFNWFGSGVFRKFYSFSDKHLDFMMRDNASKRVSGVAHFATSNGGIAAFTFIIAISLYFFNKKKYKFTIFFGVCLAIFNVIASQARMGYLTVAFSIFVFYVVYNHVYRKSIKSTLYVSIILAVGFGWIYWLYLRGNSIIMQALLRWETLESQVAEGGNRIGKVKEGLSHMVDPWDFMFGKSRGLENFYMEVEPANIFYLYGGFGFLLQYSLILFLLIYFYRNIKVVKNVPVLLSMVVASFVGLISYQFFSLSYYFFREIYIGIFPWILMGATIGIVEKYKKYPNQFDINRDDTSTKKTRKRKRYKIVW